MSWSIVSASGSALSLFPVGHLSSEVSLCRDLRRTVWFYHNLLLCIRIFAFVNDYEVFWYTWELPFVSFTQKHLDFEPPNLREPTHAAIVLRCRELGASCSLLTASRSFCIKQPLEKNVLIFPFSRPWECCLFVRLTQIHWVYHVPCSSLQVEPKKLQHAERRRWICGPLRPTKMVSFLFNKMTCWLPVGWHAWLLVLVCFCRLTKTRNFVSSSASNRIIGAKDHASIQINIAEVIHLVCISTLSLASKTHFRLRMY